MPTIIISMLLMSFLLWSYNILNKNFQTNTNATAPAIKDLSFVKRFCITLVLFIGCYTFVAFAARDRVTTIYGAGSIVDAQATTAHERESQGSQSKADDNESKPIANDKTKSVRVIPAIEIETRFKDVAGLSEAKDEVQDIISYLKDPVAFSRLGAKAPKGVLLYGEPGTGKTLLARAIAGESTVAFIAVAGSEFDEEFVGVGAARVRQLFETARDNAPCIIFIDEIDALAHRRHAHDPGWSAQTVNQLLAEMDGLDTSKNEGIIVIGASNRIDAMDPAILRPGRLDRHIKLDIPTLSEREEIIKVYLNKIKAHAAVSTNTLAKLTPGFSGADLANLINEATIIATKKNRSAVEMQDFDVAKDRVILGSKRDALKVTATSRKITAYHEAGHALVGYLLGNDFNPIYKVTITPRGPSLGHTSFEPNEEDYSTNLKQLEATIATQLAGRVAEELIFGEQNITTGAENDLQQATHLAYSMVTRWGYSKRVGTIHYSKEMNFLPKEIIEQEVQAIIQRNNARAKEVLLQNKDKLESLAKALLERETLDAKEIKALLK